MNLKKLTWEEEVDEMIKEITRTKLETRFHLRKIKELQELKSFKQDMCYQFYLRNEYLREKYNLNLLQTTPEMDMNLIEIDKLDEEADKLRKKIQNLSREECAMSIRLIRLKNDLSTFIEQHVQEIQYIQQD